MNITATRNVRWRNTKLKSAISGLYQNLLLTFFLLMEGVTFWYTSEASFVKHSYLMSKISVFAYFQNYFFIFKEHLAQRNTLVPLAPTQTAHRFIAWINVPIVRKGCIV